MQEFEIFNDSKVSLGLIVKKLWASVKVPHSAT